MEKIKLEEVENNANDQVVLVVFLRQVRLYSTRTKAMYLFHLWTLHFLAIRLESTTCAFFLHMFIVFCIAWCASYERCVSPPIWHFLNCVGCALNSTPTYKQSRYLVNCCTPVDDVASRHRRSANLHRLIAQRNRHSTHVRRAFSVGGPTVWNSLPVEQREPAVSNGVFRRTLKTILFARY